MRNYRMSYPDVLRLPLRVFWSLNAQINRLRSEEILEQIELAVVTNANATQEMITQLQEHHEKRMGTPLDIEKAIEMPTLQDHLEGTAKLRQFLR